MQRYRRSIDMDLTWTHKDVMRMSFQQSDSRHSCGNPLSCQGLLLSRCSCWIWCNACPTCHEFWRLGPLSPAPPRSNYDHLWLKKTAVFRCWFTWGISTTFSNDCASISVISSISSSKLSDLDVATGCRKITISDHCLSLRDADSTLLAESSDLWIPIKAWTVPTGPSPSRS